jgi:hypothetical protein
VYAARERQRTLDNVARLKASRTAAPQIAQPQHLPDPNRVWV